MNKTIQVRFDSTLKEKIYKNITYNVMVVHFVPSECGPLSNDLILKLGKPNFWRLNIISEV